MKTCFACKQSKPLDDFWKDARSPDGRNTRCKPCGKERNRAQYEKHKEKRLAAQMAYHWENREKEIARMRSWSKENKDKKKANNRDWRKRNPGYYAKRYASCEITAMAHRVSSRIAKVIQRNGYQKRCKTRKMLGCTWPEFVHHIESQFKPGMSWENRSEWHIDHIIPLATAKSIEDVERLSHYTNLQPLWAYENRSKGAKLDWDGP